MILFNYLFCATPFYINLEHAMNKLNWKIIIKFLYSGGGIKQS